MSERKIDPLAKQVAQRFAGFDLFAMSNLRSKTTGIEGVVLWIDSGEAAGARLQHGPRVKVMLGNKVTQDGLEDAVSVRLTTPPEVLGNLPGDIKKQVTRFVALNHEVLLRHWMGEIDSIEMGPLLRRV